MNKKYNLKLDLQFKCNNSKMIFDEFDENTSDFFMQISRQGQLVDISNAIPTLLVLKPSGTAVSQVLNVKDNLIYGNLNNSLKNEVGTYIAKLMLIEGDKKTFISNISYEVTENALLGMIDDDIVEDERYSVLLQLLERLSNIELQEQTRVDNESSRIEAENLREESIEKIKNDIDFLVNETNKKVNDNLNSNTSKIDNLIIDTKEELNKYKENKDQAINEYIEGKELELDNYIEAKNNELDLYVSEKDILIDSKISEIDSAKTQMQDSINNKLIEVENSEQLRQEEFENITSQLSSYSSDLNTVKNNIKEHNTRLNALEQGVINNSKIDNLEVKVENHETRIKANENTLKHHDILLKSLNDLDETISIENEEGTAISLPQSKDGTIIIDELEGNTLVNYCPDGAKELTLNGDIDVEGTNVTLTEGVDNGLVDVACEGSTLVNLWSRKKEDFFVENGSFENGAVTCTTGWCCSKNVEWFKPNTEYTIITNVIFISGTDVYLSVNDESFTGVFTSSTEVNVVNKVGIFVDKLTTKSTITSDVAFGARSYFHGEGSITYNMIILEGDWTNKEIPPYFEGMKSVGECEDNKIEILSQNENILNNSVQMYRANNTFSAETGNMWEKQPLELDEDGYYIGVDTGWANVLITDNFQVIPNKKYYIYAINKYKNRSYVRGVFLYDKEGNLVKRYWDSPSLGAKYIEVPSNATQMKFQISCQNNVTDEHALKVFVRIGELPSDIPSQDYWEIHQNWLINNGYCSGYSKSNKKQITLSEPLRGLLNGVKDKIVKISGKWYVERNYGSVILDGSENWRMSSSTNSYTDGTFVGALADDYLLKTGSTAKIHSITDKLPVAIKENVLEETTTNYNHYSSEWGNHYLTIKNISSLNEFKQWLQTNPTTIVYQLETPIYEEITEPTVNTYTDTTHISNNSIIPCNMKIQNTGYNAIIKPSTQYTVAFDTNKSGEVNIGLGGAKVTTINNVATITTPATLADNSLRLTGKGIKASNVRLLEGDKTNYIPSFFEGMKSCFEENLQEDESYKVEIISSNLDNSKSNKLQLQLNEPLRAVGDIKDKLVFEDNKLMVEKNCGIREYQEGDFELDNTLTDKTNTTYILNEPTYEEVPYETQKLILECFENGTLFIDTLIPPTVSVTYSANKPVVAKLNQVDNTTNVNTEDIAITQMAVDFLLMSSLGEEMINFKIKGGTNMSAYFASRIIKGALKYEDVINKYPQYKEDIDLILIAEGYSDLIVEL